MPPVIYGPILRHLPERAACCGIRTAERFQSKAAFLNPFEGDKTEEVAVLEYTVAWLRMTSTEQLVFVSSLVGRVLVQTACQEASATHTSWQPWLQTTARRRTLAWDQYSQALQHTHKPNPACRTSTAHPEGNRNAREHNCQDQEQRCWSTKVGREHQAYVQYRTRCKALPKASLKPEGERAAEMTAAEKVRSGQRIQGAMRQQPCAPNTGQPQQLAATIVEHRRAHAEGSWSPKKIAATLYN